MLLVLATVLTLAGTEPSAPAAAAAPAAVATAPPVAPALKPGERRVTLVCKTQMRTGTRFAKKRCMERADYRRQQEEDRRNFEEIQNRPIISTDRGN